MGEEYKLLFAGPMGAGKTTAIRAISDIEPIATEAKNSDKAQHSKEETTVAFDYGEVALNGSDVLRLYGMPGQSRFEFIWRFTAKGAFGVIILADNTRPNPIEDLATYVKAFDELAQRCAVVVGISRADEGDTQLFEYTDWLCDNGLPVPVLSADVRRREDVLLLLETLLSQIETHEMLTQQACL